MKKSVLYVLSLSFLIVQLSCQTRDYLVCLSWVGIPKCTATDHQKCDHLELNFDPKVPYSISRKTGGMFEVSLSRALYSSETDHAELIQGTKTQKILADLNCQTHSSFTFNIDSATFFDKGPAFVHVTLISFEGDTPKEYDIPVMLD